MLQRAVRIPRVLTLTANFNNISVYTHAALAMSPPANSRSIIHIPAAAAAAGVGKVAAVWAMKKMAVTKVLQKVGTDRAIEQLRSANKSLQEQGVYTESIGRATSSALDVLESSLKNVKEQEQVAAIWKWYERLEKDNPTLFNAVVKTYVGEWPAAFVYMQHTKLCRAPPANDGACRLSFHITRASC